MAKKGFTTQDAAMAATIALPGSAGSVSTTAIDIGPISEELGVRSEKFAFELEAPALDGTDLPSATGVVYKVQASNDSTFSAGVASWDVSDMTQTGGSGGAPGAVTQFRPPLDSPRYWRLTATVSGTVGSSITGKSIAIRHVC